MATTQRPSVLFVCAKNGGKSQIAAALMRQLAGDGVEVLSAGTKPGPALNEESAAAVAEVGASLAGEQPKPIDPAVLARVDRVVVLGSEASVEPVAGMRARIETWETDEPSTRGIEGMERMRLVRQDIAARVGALYAELTGATESVAGPVIRVFEPALCCNTGVCGPDVDESLVRFTADLEHLRGLGVDITRHNLANDPGAFAAEPAVTGFLKVAGSAGLPLVLVDGVTVATGRYPDRAELLRLAGREAEGAAPEGRTDLGLTAAGTTAAPSGGGCCGGSGPAEPGCC
ncbi:MAG: arsenite efflux transporter metallochaperone ArsD [Tetrasphaera sp.]